MDSTENNSMTIQLFWNIDCVFINVLKSEVKSRFGDSMVDTVSDIISYFTYCPLCYSNGSIVLRESDLSGLGGRDHIICASCGAKWHIKRGKWAKLVKTSLDGSGSEFLLKKHNFEFWQKMACEGFKKIIDKKKAEEDPLKVLQIRYAKGEISKEKYEEMKKILVP